MTFISGSGGQGISALAAAYDPGCGCAYWTNSPNPAHVDRCVPLRTSRLPAALAMPAPSSLAAWVGETPRPRGDTVSRWVAEAPTVDRVDAAGVVEQVYADLSAAVRANGVNELPQGFIDLALTVALTVLAEVEDTVDADPGLARRVEEAARDLPRIVAAATRDAVTVTAADAAAAPAQPLAAGGEAARSELVAGVTAELGPKLMDQIDRAVEAAVRYRLGGGG